MFAVELISGFELLCGSYLGFKTFHVRRGLEFVYV